MSKVRNFLSDESGQGMAEYGLILALVAVVAILTLTGVGTAITDKFTDISTELAK